MRKFIFLMLIGFSLLAGDFNFVVKSGDTLSKYFKKIGLSDSLLINLINSSNNAKKLNNLIVGKKLKITTKNNKFSELKYQLSKNNYLVINLIGYKFFHKIVNTKNNKVIDNISKKTLIIKSNLANAVKKSKLNNDYLKQIIKIINNKINIKHLKYNDKFKIFIRDKQIIALIYNNKQHFYFWDGLFYNKNGSIITKMFIEPLKTYKRISSGYTLSRYHPILKTYLPHRAIDYAANKGTRIYAVADGVVKYRGYSGPLGNVVKLKHKYGYETIYAHMVRFKKGVYKGKKVKQGDIIGYVGTTGRSTGNHLHYELKKDGKYKNPLKHKPNLVYKLKGKEKTQFLQYIKQFK